MSEDFGGSDKLTLIVVPDETSKVRRFQLSKKWLKYAMWGAPVLGLALMLVFGDYVRLRLDAVDVDRLSEEARERQVRVDSLAASVGNLEIQLGRIRELERKIRVIADLPDAPEMDPSTLAGAESGASPPQVAPVQPPAPVARPKARTKTVERKAAAKSAPGNTQPTKSLPAKRNPEAAGKARAKPAIELKLLGTFIRRRGRVLSRDRLLDEVWGRDSAPTDRVVDNHIMNLRRTVEPEPEQPRYVVSLRGQGYRFDG